VVVLLRGLEVVLGDDRGTLVGQHVVQDAGVPEDDGVQAGPRLDDSLQAHQIGHGDGPKAAADRSQAPGSLKFACSWPGLSLWSPRFLTQWLSSRLNERREACQRRTAAAAAAAPWEHRFGRYDTAPERFENLS
jgi:hypothetical protein